MTEEKKIGRGRPRKEPLVEPFNGEEAKSDPLAKVEKKPKGKRKPRVPLGGVHRKLAVENKDPNYVYHVFNDVGGRLEKAKDAWWEPVNDANGNVDRRVVGSTSSGQPLYGQVMRIEKSIYEQDQAAKQKPIDEMEASMKQGLVSGGIVPGQNGYIPSSGIKIEHG